MSAPTHLPKRRMRPIDRALVLRRLIVTIQDQSASIAALTTAVNSLLGKVASLEAQLAAPPTVTTLTPADQDTLAADVAATDALAAQVNAVLNPPPPPAAPAAEVASEVAPSIDVPTQDTVELPAA